MCQVWFHAFSVKSDQGSQRRPKGIAVYVNFSIPPSLVITQVKKSLKITYSSISPYSQHFIFSLLPTFSPLFLPPPYFFRPFLPPPYCVPPPSCFTIGCRQRSRNWQKTPTGQSFTQVVQLLISFRNKSSAASNSTFISFGSSVLFFSRNWRAASRVFLMLNWSDSLAFVVRWTSTSGIKIWITCWSVFQLRTVSWTLFASKILAWICCL